MVRTLRPIEFWLLLYPIALFAAGSIALELVRGAEWPISDFGVIAVFAGLMIAVNLVLSARLGRADQGLVPIVATLTALGLILVERLEPSLAPRQLLWVLIGVAALLVTAFALPRVEVLGRFRYTLLAVGLVVMTATMVFGIDPNRSGARLWLGFGGYYFQPSEIMKIVVVIFFASYLAEKRALITHSPLRLGRFALPPLAYLAPLVLMWVLSMAILVWQRDLGAALLFYLVFVAMLYAATGRTYIGVALIFLAIGALVAYGLFDHVQLRTRVWLNPWPYADGDAYQIVQALSAYAAGGVIGSGLGYGYPDYVPAVFTDFVLAALGEELGLLGTIAVVALYLALVHRAFRIALRATSDFGMLLAAGLGATLGLQAIVILAGTLRIIPITGITLPFMSYGGSSILANYVMVGILLRISAEPQPGGRARG
jgi:cell division protein FtsW (lipid II flippase)